METDFKILANKVINVNGLPSKQKVIVFSFCLFISLFFWLLIKFSKDFQLTVRCPVSFVNLPTDRVLMCNADTSFLITIKAQGFQLLYYQLFQKKNILKLDVAQIQRNSNTSDSISYLGYSQLSKLIGKQIDFNYEIINFLPDTFALHWEKAFFKKLPVKLNLTISYQKQYQLYDTIQIEPDSIYVSGTTADLAQLNYFVTKKLVLNNLCTSQYLFLDIVQPPHLSKIKMFTEKVKLSIAVEKFTETEIEVPVTTLNNTGKIKFFPEKVKLTYQVALKDFKKVSREMFEAVADVDKSKTTDGINVKVELLKYPSFVKITKIYPEKIEYIIFK